MGRVRVHAPQDLVAGASLLAVSLFALWAAGPLDSGRLGAPGPGLLPRVLAVLLGAVGVWLLVLSLIRPGESLGRWPLRGPAADLPLGGGLRRDHPDSRAGGGRTGVDSGGGRGLSGDSLAGADGVRGGGDRGVHRAVPLAPASAHPDPGDSGLGGPVRGAR